MLKKTRSIGAIISRKELRALIGGRAPCYFFAPISAKKCEAFCISNPFYVCYYDPYDQACEACPSFGD